MKKLRSEQLRADFSFPNYGPLEKNLRASFSGKERKQGIHKNFFGGGRFGSKGGFLNGPVWPTRNLVDCFSCPPEKDLTFFKEDLTSTYFSTTEALT